MPREAPGSSLLIEHRRLVASAGEHAKQLQAAMPDDLFGSPLRVHVDGVLADLRALWGHGEEWEKGLDRLADLLDEANGDAYRAEGERDRALDEAWAARQ